MKINYRQLPVIKPEGGRESTIRFYGKKDPYFEFSNYFPFSIDVHSVSYPSSENYYQAQKFVYIGASQDTLDYSDIVGQTNTPNKARILALQKIGGGYKWRTDLNSIIQEYKEKGVRMDPNWDEVRDNVMRSVVYAKFRNTKLQEKLLQTYPSTLIEASPRDDYWGEGKHKTGKNKLGRILEEVRFIIRILEDQPLSIPPPPYKKSQWVIPGILLASAYPESDKIVQDMVDKGQITVFVDLIDKKQRKRMNLYPYFDSPTFDQKYISFPIEDRKIQDDEETFTIASNLASFISQGEVIVIHCLGGKGRTGVIVALMMWLLYGMTSKDVLYFTEKNFHLRKDKGKRCLHSPQTRTQIAQVKRIINST